MYFSEFSRRDTSLWKLADAYVQMLFTFFMENKQMWLYIAGDN